MIFLAGPALWIVPVEIAGVAFCHSGTTTAELTEPASGALGEFVVVSVCLHVGDPHVGEAILKDVADFTLCHSAAGVNISGGQDRDMAVAAVAAAVDHAVAGVGRYFEITFFVFIKRP